MRIHIWIASVVLLLSQTLLAAADYPTRPIRFIVPFAPGGNGDIMARLLGQRLSENLGQSVVIDNRPGANSIIGTDLAVKSPPDGYTIIIVANAHFANPVLAKTLPYDTVRDLAPISLAGSTPLILVTHPNLPVTTLKDLIALARSRPGLLNYGSASTGGSGHLAGALLAVMANINLVHVAYRGTAQATSDLLAGQIQLGFPSMTSVLPYIRAGKLRPLGISGLKRSVLAPEIPTIAESGVPKYQSSIWNGILAPAATPKAIIGRLNEEVVRVLSATDVQQRFASMGADVERSSPQEFEAFIVAEIKKWAAVVKSSGIKPE